MGRILIEIWINLLRIPQPSDVKVRHNVQSPNLRFLLPKPRTEHDRGRDLPHLTGRGRQTGCSIRADLRVTYFCSKSGDNEDMNCRLPFS